VKNSQCNHGMEKPAVSQQGANPHFRLALYSRVENGITVMPQTKCNRRSVQKHARKASLRAQKQICPKRLLCTVQCTFLIAAHAVWTAIRRQITSRPRCKSIAQPTEYTAVCESGSWCRSSCRNMDNQRIRMCIPAAI
jgi:hypothetical protein